MRALGKDAALSGPPGPKQFEVPAGFLERVWSELFPDITSNTVYDDQSAQFITVKNESSAYVTANHVFCLVLEYLTLARLAKKAADDRKAHFIQILTAWDEEHKKQDKKSLRGRKHEALCKVRANISEKHTWDEVLAELQKVQEEANNATGLVSRVRKFLGKVADKNDMIMPVIEFIPNGNYGSVLCGGLKFILGVGP